MTVDLSRFHVLTVVSNPWRYKSRYENFKRFEKGVLAETPNLWVVELMTGRRPAAITDSANPKHIQLWATSLHGDLWQKEAMLNVAVMHLTRQAPDWQYVMWADADILFEPGWAKECVQMLHHYDIVQGFSHAIDLGPNNECLQVQDGFVWCMEKKKKPHSKAYENYHSGFVWAARRKALADLGGFIDTAILGSADRYMASALYGKLARDILGFDKFHEAYNQPALLWQERAKKHIKRNVGYLPQTIRHLFHGRKQLRGYGSRFKLLQKYQFNPETDLKRDLSGIWQLVVDTPRQMGFRDDVRKYMRARSEDSIDVE
jgi:hypothetical protein